MVTPLTRLSRFLPNNLADDIYDETFSRLIEPDHPAHRGAGVGRALIESVYHAADANATPSVYWLMQEFNHTARQLYDRVATVTPFIKYTR